MCSVACGKIYLPGGAWKGADEETASLVAGQGRSLKQTREYERGSHQKRNAESPGLAGPTPPPPSFLPAWAR